MIGGAGFARMAWKLAISRSRPPFTGDHPAERHVVEASPPGCYPRAREYYRIIDRAASATANTPDGWTSRVYL